MDMFDTFLLVIGVMALIFSLYNAKKDRVSIEASIRRAVERIGGKQIEISNKVVWGDDSGTNYIVVFKDVEQRHYYEEVRVPHSIFGNPGPLQWSRPLRLKPSSIPQPEQRSSSSSKEQLIAEMDAEIEALRAALAASEQSES